MNTGEKTFEDIMAEKDKDTYECTACDWTGKFSQLGGFLTSGNDIRYTCPGCNNAIFLKKNGEYMYYQNKNQ